jgi:hypothetical protein
MKTRYSTSYRFTVQMKDGKPVETQAHLVEALRKTIAAEDAWKGTRRYVKLQGRLGESNANAWKYRSRRDGGIYGRAQCVRLPDAAYADVYVYQR